MKNFSLGVLITLTLGLFMQNISLRDQLVVAQQFKKSNQVIVKKNNPIKKAQPVVAQVAKKVTTEEAPIVADNSGGRDPRCPSHLPYYTSYWGCVVKRP